MLGLDLLLESRYLLSQSVHGPIIGPITQGSNPLALFGPALRHFVGADQAPVSSLTGKGQVIYDVEAGMPSNFWSDLQTFAQRLGRPLWPGEVTVVSPPGDHSTTDPRGWGVETLLDVEEELELAPGAQIRVEQVSAAFLFTLAAGVQDAVAHKDASVVSMSYGGSEIGSFTVDPEFISKYRIAFTASSGDSGAKSLHDVISPATSQYVVSIGGTSFSTSLSGRYLGETAWSGSGGGVSDPSLDAPPPYQKHTQGVNRTGRNVPDVSWVADPDPGVLIYDSDLSDLHVTGMPGGWVAVGGTSAGAPGWASLIALADQYRAEHYRLGHLTTFDINTALYTAPAHDFHDITVGSNGFFSAHKGYDQVTGLGTPAEQRLIPYLAQAKHVATPPIRPFKFQGHGPVLHPLVRVFEEAGHGSHS